MLSVIAWTCIVLAAALLAVSAWAFVRTWRAGGSEVLRRSVYQDALVLVLWITMLVCGIGLAQRRWWGWAGIQVAAIGVLGWMSFLAWHRLATLRDLEEDIPGTWRPALTGHVIVLVVLGVIVAGLVIYLQSDAARAQMG
ncbi:MAG TPA: hypothetical protein VFS20_17465 [Longimicrobium sp.]|nr:hypothetical protein [Longimicrobium sp.]